MMSFAVRRNPLSASFIFLALIVLIAGCGESQTPPVAEVARPVQILEVSETQMASSLRFPGRVRAATRAELTFNVAGKLIELPVNEGQRVAMGELIGAIDPEPFELRLAAVQAEYEKARVDYERVARILQTSQAVTRAEVDQKRTVMEVALSHFAAARKELEDSRLTAPFAGVIARRFVENFQNIQAKEPIVSLQDLDELEIVIHVPERVVYHAPRRASGSVVFESLPGRLFPAELKAYATEADSQTQTYEVVFALTRPQDVNILPGMTAEVLPEAARADDALGLTIPINAIYAEADGRPHVWVVNPDSSRVERRAVELGGMTDNSAVITAGLVSGEQIVTAGVHHLRVGMLVRPL